jgi:hypothetical protein
MNHDQTDPAACIENAQKALRQIATHMDALDDVYEREMAAISVRISEIGVDLAFAKEALEPAPVENPRPALPQGFTVAADGLNVVLSWDTPLPAGTPGVQVHRMGASGWVDLTKGAINGLNDTPPDAGTQYYRIRGYGYKLDGTAHASPWSGVRTVTTSEPAPEPEPAPAPKPGAFRALDAVGNTVEENKSLLIPEMRQQREARTPVGTIGDVKRSDWNVGDGDLVKEDLESVVPEGYAQWSSNLHKKMEVRPGSYTWENIGVSPADGARQLKWGTREFNVPFRRFLSCDFTEIPREHGFYVSNYEGSEVKDCTFLRCGSQGVQFAHRPLPYQQYDGDNLPYAEPPTHVVSNCHFVDNAFKGDRPSFNLTYFNPGTSENPGTILVENSTFVCDWPEPKFYGGKELRSTGAMVVGNMQGNAPLVGNPMMDAITLRNNLYDFTKNDRAIIELRSVEELFIEDCCFISRDSGYPLVMMDKYIDDEAIKSKRITIRNTHAEGGTGLKIRKVDGTTATFDMHCPGEEIVIDAVNCTIISRTSL